MRPMAADASETPIRWGILGCGDVCEVKAGPAFYRAPGSSLVAVMRRDAAAAADFARRHGVARSYATAAELLADPAVDAVYVAAPPGAHAELALAACAARKPTYLEKPLARSGVEVRDLGPLARQRFVSRRSRRGGPTRASLEPPLRAALCGDRAPRFVLISFLYPHSRARAALCAVDRRRLGCGAAGATDRRRVRARGRAAIRGVLPPPPAQVRGGEARRAAARPPHVDLRAPLSGRCRRCSLRCFSRWSGFLTSSMFFHFGRRTSSGVSRRSVASVRWLLRWASAGRAG